MVIKKSKDSQKELLLYCMRSIRENKNNWGFCSEHASLRYGGGENQEFIFGDFMFVMLFWYANVVLGKAVENPDRKEITGQDDVI